MADFKCVVCKHHYTPSDSQPCDNFEYIGDGRYSAYSPCTNADRIRAMTDEELATFLYNFGDCPCFGVKFCERGTSCEDAVLMKLKEPVDNSACLANETSEKVKDGE